MIPTRARSPQEEVETSRPTIGTKATSSILLGAITIMMRTPLFSAANLVVGVSLAAVFRVAATCYESGDVVASSSEVIEEEIVVDSPRVVTHVTTDDTWQVVAARLVDLPARPTIPVLCY